MIPIRGVVACVNYDDLLAITLPLNMRHFTNCVVVTSWEDKRTQELCSQFSDVHCFITDAFTSHGASFNKGLAFTEMWEKLGTEGWITVWDADTILPDTLAGIKSCAPGSLYSAQRRILEDPKQWKPNLDWTTCPITKDIVFPGYFHLFHASDPALLPPPWYDCTFKHAGGGDGFFQSRWPKSKKIRLPFEVLHLGPRDTNWFGRASERLDGLPPATDSKAMHEFRQADWRRRRDRRARGVDARTHSCIWLDESYDERVSIPGHEPRVWVHGRDE